jgi:hypothetical protein
LFEALALFGSEGALFASWINYFTFFIVYMSEGTPFCVVATEGIYLGFLVGVPGP